MNTINYSSESFPAQVASGGIAMGKALIFGKKAFLEKNYESSDPSYFLEAVQETKFQLKDLASTKSQIEGDILEFQLSLLDDSELIEPVLNSIRANETCSVAWQKRLDSMIVEFEEETDPYFKARAEDLKDLKNRVLRNLNKTNEILSNPIQNLNTSEKSIVLADEMTPSEFIETDWNQNVGVVLKNCSPNSHVAILARSYGIPMLTDLRIPLDKMKSDTIVILDGDKGFLIIDPTLKEMEEYQGILQKNWEKNQLQECLLSKPVKNFNGDTVLVKINADSVEMLTKINPEHCDGIGLTRTEFLIKDGRLPDEEEQFQVYSNLVLWSSGKPVTIRTLDAGGDKPIEGVTINERNPFLGFRGIRVSLKFEEIFRIQLRALLRAAVLGPVQVMLPMVTVAEEVEEARKMMSEEHLKLQKRNINVQMPKLGMMVEVPLAALAIETFNVDFYSIGSNDLIQYLSATARDNQTVSHLYHANYPSFWQLISRISAHGRKTGREVSICGDIASNPDYLDKIMECRISSLSVSPGSLAHVKTYLASMSPIDEMSREGGTERIH